MNPYEGLGFGHRGSFQSSDDDEDVPQALKSISTFESRNLPLDFHDRERDSDVRYLLSLSLSLCILMCVSLIPMMFKLIIDLLAIYFCHQDVAFFVLLMPKIFSIFDAGGVWT